MQDFGWKINSKNYFSVRRKCTYIKKPRKSLSLILTFFNTGSRISNFLGKAKSKVKLFNGNGGAEIGNPDSSKTHQRARVKTPAPGFFGKSF